MSKRPCRYHYPGHSFECLSSIAKLDRVLPGPIGFTIHADEGDSYLAYSSLQLSDELLVRARVERER
jgi:hypothetical protein